LILKNNIKIPKDWESDAEILKFVYTGKCENLE
jgi:hypothetical protein